MPKTTAGRQRERCQAQQSMTSVKAHAPGTDDPATEQHQAQPVI